VEPVFLGEAIPTRAPGAGPRPPWLKNKVRTGPSYLGLKRLVKDLKLHTVCEEAGCPNIFECWESKEATFLILGDKCTRRCGFCDIDTGKPGPLDTDEPLRVAEAVAALELSYAVVTGVERDDAEPAAVARIWAGTVAAIRARVPGCGVEILTGDLKGDPEAIRIVAESRPEVFAHNIETPRWLHRKVRPGFRYDRTLMVLAAVKSHNPAQPTKSNIIVGLGESNEDVLATLGDLRTAGVDIVTIGQYLAPSVNHHLSVQRWVAPEEFTAYHQAGMDMGFAWVEAGPLVRSSYRAGTQYKAAAARLSAAP
jgi:lipoic acid synthetase